MNKPYRILVADTDREFTDSINKIAQGYAAQLTIIDSGAKVLEYAKSIRPHLIILEIELPEIDGIELCQSIREEPTLSNTVVTFLTNISDDYIQVAAFKAGCDDYILKTTKPRLLTYRILALLNRQHDSSSENTNNFESIEPNKSFYIDTEKFLVIADTKKVYLPKKQFLLLQLLASSPSKVFTRESIFNYIWGNSSKVGLRTIDVYIRKIRERIGLKYIKTIKGVGYRFE